MSDHKYVIVGGGLTAASAVEGIRAHDPDGSILLLTRENFLPYHRPPLSKDLWFGKKTIDEVPVHPEKFWTDNKVTVELRREIVELDPENRRVQDERGVAWGYEKLLLATGGRPRRLDVEGSNREGIHYFRGLEDYLALKERIGHQEHVLVLGGGFIATELAAALRHAGQEVTFLYPREYPLHRVLPRDLGLAVAELYRERGIETVSNQMIVGFEEQGGLIVARTRTGDLVSTQTVVVGAGIEPQVDLAEVADLEVGNGIEVDDHARTTDRNIWAAGDVAEFPYLALGRTARIEHWDHALHHGKVAGANMAGADQVYDHIPMFWSDFFDLGCEAVGEVEAGLETVAVWKEPMREGIVFYRRDDVVRGVLLWNVWERVEWARGLIREAQPMGRAELESAAAL
jgi:3-phenylpropionate/trans-cinnamate dioxygenase ferredoxin reductase subunit